jgi:hypothetical protein
MADARALTMTTLAYGKRVIVCGSHDLVHRRSGRLARSVGELVQLAAERRLRRRRAGSSDELADLLSGAFAPARRAQLDRRRAG